MEINAEIIYAERIIEFPYQSFMKQGRAVLALPNCPEELEL